MKTAEIKDTLASLDYLLKHAYLRTRSPIVRHNIEAVSHGLNMLHVEVGLLAQRKFKDGYDKAIADFLLKDIPIEEEVELPIDFVSGLSHVIDEEVPFP